MNLQQLSENLINNPSIILDNDPNNILNLSINEFRIFYSRLMLRITQLTQIRRRSNLQNIQLMDLLNLRAYFTDVENFYNRLRIQ